MLMRYIIIYIIFVLIADVYKIKLLIFKHTFNLENQSFCIEKINKKRSSLAYIHKDKGLVDLLLVESLYKLL